jgi:hypothetical protein
VRRFSTPVPNALYHEFDKRVPDGIKSTVIRGLIRIMLASPGSVIWDVASHEENPELFELKMKEPT